MAEGFEESEIIIIVDILRRSGLTCDTFYFSKQFVKSMHGVYVKADQLFGEEINTYDMIVLPCGKLGGQHLTENEEVIKTVRYFNEKNKFIAAISTGIPSVEKAGVLTGKRVAEYSDSTDKLSNSNFIDQVVVDQNIITSQGPATAFPFAYKLAEVLGEDTEILRDRMLYTFAGGK